MMASPGEAPLFAIHHGACVSSQITALADAGIGILFSTCDPDQAFMCADRVMLLRSGGIPRVGSPDVTITRDNLRELYGIRRRDRRAS